MKHILAISAAAMISSASFPNTALATTYSCSISTNQSLGWIAKTILFEEIAGRPTVKEFDGITYQTSGGAIEARILAQSKKRLTFKWRTGNMSSRSKQETAFDYRVTYLRAKKLAIVYAKPRGFHNDFSARGPCVVMNITIDAFLKKLKK